jgi:hypothetical protein
MKYVILFFLIILTSKINAQDSLAISKKNNIFYGGAIEFGTTRAWEKRYYYEYSTQIYKYTKAFGANIFIGAKFLKSFETFSKLKFQQLNSCLASYEYNHQTNVTGKQLYIDLHISNFLLLEQTLRWNYKKVYIETGIQLGHFINSKVKRDTEEFKSINHPSFPLSKNPIFVVFGGGYKLYSNNTLDINLGFNISLRRKYEMKAAFLHLQLQKK